VFDPDFNNTHDIYVAHTYDADLGEEELDRRVKITRFTYNSEAATIGDPLDLISGLFGSVDHNSGRMTFGPDGRPHDLCDHRLDRPCSGPQGRTDR
jgi:glucose/arabinose dehydrogenase